MSLKKEYNRVVLRQNKVLLQRISNILTAPPTITDEDYLRMRKLVCTMKGPRELYEQNLIDQKNKVFFEDLKKIGPVYNPKEWEHDYQRQLFGQRFMRQVTYERPKDFDDQYTPAIRQPAINKEYMLLKRRQVANSASTSSQVHRIQRQKSLGFADNNVRSRLEPDGSEMWPWAEDYPDDTIPEDVQGSGYEDDADPDLEGVDLGRVERLIKIVDNTLGSTNETSTYEARAHISCWLAVVEGTLGILVISAQVIDDIRLSAEAEIELAQLLNIRDISLSSLEKSPDILASISHEILGTVELRIEEGIPRLLLTFSAQPLDEYSILESSISDASLDKSVNVEFHHPNEPNCEEAISNLTNVKKIMTIPVLYLPVLESSNAKPLKVQKNKIEQLQVVIEVKSGAENALVIKVTPQADSDGTFASKRQGGKLVVIPAVKKGDIIEVETRIPSLISVDVDVMLSFIENLISCTRIEHDEKTGVNVLTMV